MNLFHRLLKSLLYFIAITFLIAPILTLILPSPLESIKIPTGCFYERDYYGWPMSFIEITKTDCMGQKLEKPYYDLNYANSIYNVIYYIVLLILVRKVFKSILRYKKATPLPTLTQEGTPTQTDKTE